MHKLEVMAHRGASDVAPENTVAAIRRAWTTGADAVEFDIHLTSDNRIVVMHDSNTTRTSGVDMNIHDHTFEELRTLDVGKWKGSEWTGEKIPTLEEAISTIPNGKRVFAEVKCATEILPEFARVIRASRMKPSQIAIIGFDLGTMTAAKDALAAHQVYWLTINITDDIISSAKSAGLDGLDVESNGIDAKLAETTHAAGLKLYAWTVDTQNRARAVMEARVDGITTNRTAWLLDLVRNGE